MNRCLVPILVLFLAAASAASAAELAGVSFPDRAHLGERELVLNGLGLREATFLKVNVYVAGLYLERRAADADAILDSSESKRLILRFLRSVSREKIVEAWNEGFRKNAATVLPALKERLERFNGWMRDVEKGQELSFTFLPQGVEVAVGAEIRGTVEGDDFSKALLSVWLGPEPPNAGLKEGLLGGR